MFVYRIQGNFCRSQLEALPINLDNYDLNRYMYTFHLAVFEVVAVLLFSQIMSLYNQTMHWQYSKDIHTVTVI